MTTIAYRDGVLAADSLVSNNGARLGRVKKVFQRGAILAGVAGCLAPAQAFRDWFTRGAIGNPPDMAGKYEADGEAFIVMPDDLIVTFDKFGVDAIRADFYATGSGSKVAMGAMAAGATAEEAVRIAATIDCGTGGEITVLRR